MQTQTNAKSNKAVAAVKPAAEKKARTPKNIKLASTLGRTFKAILKVEKACAGSANETAIAASSKLADLLAELAEVHTAIEKLPADAFGRAPKASKEIIIGSLVDVREKKAAEYADLMGKDEIVGMTVKSISGKVASCVTKKGINFFGPLSYLTLSK